MAGRRHRREPPGAPSARGGPSPRTFFGTLLSEPGGGLRLLVLGVAFAALAETRGVGVALAVLGTGIAAAVGVGYAIWRRRGGRRRAR